jgi:UDP-N-acetylglucosamine diphosphorylase/glucosamine-1-phosphate N-acetyltransferase
MNNYMIVLIMAGGLGKRMESTIPKVLHEVVNPENKDEKLPMLIHVIKTALKANPTNIFIIVGKYKDIIEKEINKYIELNIISNNIEYIIQQEALGTGHAILCSLPQIKKYNNEQVIILSGDVPLISINTLNNLIEDEYNKLLITKLDNPFGSGRIIWDDNNNIIRIVEEKDCNNDERFIKYVNCGIYKIRSNDLLNLIPKIDNKNKSNEYYLTDIIDLMRKDNVVIKSYELTSQNIYEIKNVNTKDDLDNLNHFILKKL